MHGALDYVVIGVYFAVMLGAAFWGYRRAKTADDYLVAGRRLGHPMFIGTLSAVVLGGASTIGTVSLGYENGLSGAALVFMIGLGLIGLGLLLAKRLAHAGVYTVPELMAKRYGIPSRIVSAAIMAAYALMIAVTSTIASGTVFNELLDVSSTVAILLAGGVVVLYCVTGGMWSLTLTDIIQFGIMTVGIFVLLLPFALIEAGGLAGAALPDGYLDPTAIGWDTIFTYFLLFFFGLMIGQDIWQRIFTGRDEKVMRTGTIVAGVYCIAYGIAGALIGAAAKVIAAEPRQPGRRVRRRRRRRAADGADRARARGRAGGDHVDRQRRRCWPPRRSSPTTCCRWSARSRTRCAPPASRRSWSAPPWSASRSCSTTWSARSPSPTTCSPARCSCRSCSGCCGPRGTAARRGRRRWRSPRW